MDAEMAKLAIRFMERVQLQGQEVPAFNAVMQALHEEVKPSDTSDDKPKATEQQ